MSNLLSNQPKGSFRHSMSMPGLPVTTTLGMIAMLMNVYGVSHQFPLDPNFVIESITTGNDRVDRDNTVVYLDLKNMLDAYSREYSKVEATGQIFGNIVIITFTCW